MRSGGAELVEPMLATLTFEVDPYCSLQAARRHAISRRAASTRADTAFLVSHARVLRRRVALIHGGSDSERRVALLAVLLAHDGLCLACVARRATLSLAETDRTLRDLERGDVVGEHEGVCTKCDHTELRPVFGVRGTPVFPFTPPAPAG